jgi:hypothetical protein
MDSAERLLGYRRFSLIIRNRIQSNRQVLRQLAEDLGLVYHDLSLVRVRINSWEERLYYLQPPFDDAFFETKGMASLRTFNREVSPTDSSHKSMLDIRNDEAHFGPSVYQADFLSILDDAMYSFDQRREIIARHKELNEILRTGDYERIPEFFDFEYITSFDAFRTIIAASQHGFHIEANFHVAYNLANGKFYPVVTEDIYWKRLHLAEGQPVEEALDNYKEHGEAKLLRFFSLLSRNDRIRQRKYEKIFETISKKPEEMVRQHQLIMARYDDLHYFGVFKQLLRKFGLSGFPVHTENNIKVLGSYLEAADPAVQVEQFADGLRIAITPRSMAGLRVSSLGLREADIGALEEILVGEEDEEGPRILRASSPAKASRDAAAAVAIDDLVLSDTVGESSRRSERRYFVQVRFNHAHSLPTDHRPRLALVNAVTGKPVPATADHVLREEPLPVRASGFVTDANREREQLEQYAAFLDFDLRDGEIVIPEGTYVIDQDVILTEGRRLVIEAGVKLLLGPDVLLMSKNGLEVRGTLDKPVTITAKDPAKPFGAVGILGNDTATADIRYLSLSHGRERLAEGVYFSGALSIYHTPRILIEDTRFENNFADQVDLDYCDGLVVRSSFTNERGDANGDGLDLSGSKVIVFDNDFDSQNDKGLSIGEGSQIYVLFDRFTNNNLGAAVKDSSLAYFYGNSFHQNATDLSLYRKKNIWGGATAHLLSLADAPPAIGYTTDSGSRVAHHVLDQSAADSWKTRLENIPKGGRAADLEIDDYLSLIESRLPTD